MTSFFKSDFFSRYFSESPPPQGGPAGKFSFSLSPIPPLPLSGRPCGTPLPPRFTLPPMWWKGCSRILTSARDLATRCGGFFFLLYGHRPWVARPACLLSAACKNALIHPRRPYPQHTAAARDCPRVLAGSAGEHQSAFPPKVELSPAPLSPPPPPPLKTIPFACCLLGFFSPLFFYSLRI